MSIVLHDNNITFNNVSLPGGITEQRRANIQYSLIDEDADGSPDQIDAISQQNRFVNCIDIDWNGVEVPSGDSTTTLNTTTDFLSWLLREFEDIRLKITRVDMTGRIPILNIQGQYQNMGINQDSNIKVFYGSEIALPSRVTLKWSKKYTYDYLKYDDERVWRYKNIDINPGEIPLPSDNVYEFYCSYIDAANGDITPINVDHNTLYYQIVKNPITLTKYSQGINIKDNSTPITFYVQTDAPVKLRFCIDEDIPGYNVHAYSDNYFDVKLVDRITTNGETNVFYRNNVETVFKTNHEICIIPAQGLNINSLGGDISFSPWKIYVTVAEIQHINSVDDKYDLCFKENNTYKSGNNRIQDVHRRPIKILVPQRFDVNYFLGECSQDPQNESFPMDSSNQEITNPQSYFSNSDLTYRFPQTSHIYPHQNLNITDEWTAYITSNGREIYYDHGNSNKTFQINSNLNVYMIYYFTIILHYHTESHLEMVGYVHSFNKGNKYLPPEYSNKIKLIVDDNTIIVDGNEQFITEWSTSQDGSQSGNNLTYTYGQEISSEDFANIDTNLLDNNKALHLYANYGSDRQEITINFWDFYSGDDKMYNTLDGDWPEDALLQKYQRHDPHPILIYSRKAYVGDRITPPNYLIEERAGTIPYDPNIYEFRGWNIEPGAFSNENYVDKDSLIEVNHITGSNDYDNYGHNYVGPNIVNYCAQYTYTVEYYGGVYFDNNNDIVDGTQYQNSNYVETAPIVYSDIDNSNSVHRSIMWRRDAWGGYGASEAINHIQGPAIIPERCTFIGWDLKTSGPNIFLKDNNTYGNYSNGSFNFRFNGPSIKLFGRWSQTPKNEAIVYYWYIGNAIEIIYGNLSPQDPLQMASEGLMETDYQLFAPTGCNPLLSSSNTTDPGWRGIPRDGSNDYDENYQFDASNNPIIFNESSYKYLIIPLNDNMEPILTFASGSWSGWTAKRISKIGNVWYQEWCSDTALSSWDGHLVINEDLVDLGRL